MARRLGRVCKLQTGCLCSQRVRAVVIDMAQNISLVQRSEPVERLFGKANCTFYGRNMPIFLVSLSLQTHPSNHTVKTSFKSRQAC